MRPPDAFSWPFISELTMAYSLPSRTGGDGARSLPRARSHGATLAHAARIVAALVLSPAVAALVLSPTVAARADEPAAVDYSKMNLEQLMEVEVTSVSKRPQKANEAAAAVFVITQDDIRTSGATNIPEVLRMAPGVQVAQLDANKWAISIRGFNGRYSNKLLVMQDGRNLYTPVFGGVFWDLYDTMLEDIERIEVIRGPGGTLWGANAVNGVINIITKNAKDTQGALAFAEAGTERYAGGGRYGGMIGEDLSWRAFAKYFKQDASVLADGQTASDNWDQGRIGFRTDWEPKTGTRSASPAICFRATRSAPIRSITHCCHPISGRPRTPAKAAAALPSAPGSMNYPPTPSLP